MPEILATLRVPLYASAPGGAVGGQLYYHTGNNTLNYYNGTTWVAIGTGSGDVIGAASSNDNTIVLFNSTTGKVIKAAPATSGIVTSATGVFGVTADNHTNWDTAYSAFPASSVDSEIALFSSTTGKVIKRATGSGLALVTAGVLSAVTDNRTNWDTAFTDRNKWDGGSTGLTAATGRASLGIGDSAIYENASGAGSSGYSSNAIVPGSTITIPTAGGWTQGGQYHCVFDMQKTAAGTAAIAINVHMGTLGSTGDAIVGTSSFGAGSNVADSGVFEIYVTFKTVGSGTSAVVVLSARLTRAQQVAAFVNGTNPNAATGATSAGFASTTQTKISIGFNGGSLFSGTNTFTQTRYMQ